MSTVKTRLNRFWELAEDIGAPVEFYEGVSLPTGEGYPTKLELCESDYPLEPRALASSAVEHLRAIAGKLLALADAIDADTESEVVA